MLGLLTWKWPRSVINRASSFTVLMESQLITNMGCIIRSGIKFVMDARGLTMFIFFSLLFYCWPPSSSSFLLSCYVHRRIDRFNLILLDLTVCAFFTYLDHCTGTTATADYCKTRESHGYYSLNLLILPVVSCIILWVIAYNRLLHYNNDVIAYVCVCLTKVFIIEMLDM